MGNGPSVERSAIQISFQNSLDQSDEKEKELKSPEKEYYALYLNEKFSDVTFIVGKKREKIFAHKTLLAARSQVFEKMLFSDTTSGDAEVEISDMEAETFKIMLESIYCDRVTLNDRTIMPVLYAAKKYKIQSLVSICGRYMQRGASIKNACNLLDSSFLLEDQAEGTITNQGIPSTSPLPSNNDIEDQNNLALDFIERNTEAVFRTDSFLNLSTRSLIRILKSDHLGMEEIDIFQFCLKWARQQCKLRGLKYENPEHRQQVLQPIVPYIRFPCMSSEQIARIVVPTNALTNVQLLPLFIYLNSDMHQEKKQMNEDDEEEEEDDEDDEEEEEEDQKEDEKKEIDEKGSNEEKKRGIISIEEKKTDNESNGPLKDVSSLGYFDLQYTKDVRELHYTELKESKEQKETKEVKESKEKKETKEREEKYNPLRKQSSLTQKKKKKINDTKKLSKQDHEYTLIPSSSSSSPILASILNTQTNSLMNLTLTFNISPRTPHMDDWILDKQYKSPNLLLSNRSMTASIGTTPGHQFVFGTKVFDKGKHAWRTHIERLNGNQWVFIGVGERGKEFLKKTLSFGDPSAWGFSSANQIYVGGVRRIKSSNVNYKNGTIDWVQGHVIDCILDCDQGTIKFYNLVTRTEFTLRNLPKLKYSPHFNLYGVNNAIRIEVLHPSQYSKS